MKYLFIPMLLFCFACGREKSVQLPEIRHSEIRDVQKKSKAFMVYDDDPKALEFNRANLNTSRNWLLYIDKRIPLKQLMPSLIQLQDKKQEAKKKDQKIGKNYFTCNDSASKTLGFIDFSDVVYHNDIDKSIVENNTVYDIPSTNTMSHSISIIFKMKDSLSINSEKTTKLKFIERLRQMDSIQDKMIGIIYLKFNKNLTFQDYIIYKSMISEAKLKHTILSDDEYIFN